MPPVMGYTAWTKAAFGEKVPLKPPASAHATILCVALEPLTKMPMSWLIPAVLVNRDAFPVRIATQLNAGVILRTRSGPPVTPGTGIISTKVWPLLFCNPSCFVVTAVNRA